MLVTAKTVSAKYFAFHCPGDIWKICNAWGSCQRSQFSRAYYWLLKSTEGWRKYTSI